MIFPDSDKKMPLLLSSEKEMGLTIVFGLMILWTEQNLLVEKESCKGYAIRPFGSGGSKIVFVLLDKIITVYIGFIVV